MQIWKKEPGDILIEQYGHKYIQYDSGQISEVILPLKITDDEFNRIRNGEISMERVVNYYENQGLCSADALRCNFLKDYFRATGRYSESQLAEIIQNLKKHGDIFFEFYDYVLYEQFPQEGISINGITAENLVEQYGLSPIDAYSCLICLRNGSQEDIIPRIQKVDISVGIGSRMKVIKKCKRGNIIQRYGNLYIRFYGGREEMPCEFSVSDDDVQKILDNESYIHTVFKELEESIEWTPDTFFRIGTIEFLRYGIGQSETLAEKTYAKLLRHEDIRNELYYRIMQEEYWQEPVSVEGYTAKQLEENYQLSMLGAYNYLIYLREHPQEALEDLKAGLLTK